MPAKKKPQGQPPTLSVTGETWEYLPHAPGAQGATAGRRGPASAVEARSALPDFIAEGPDFELLESGELRSGKERRSSAGSSASHLRLTLDEAEDADVLLVLRHESGALTFHRPNVTSRRSGNEDATSRAGFDIWLPGSSATGGRRGPVSKLLKLALVRVTASARKLLVAKLGEWSGEKVIDYLVPKVAVKL